MSPCHEICECHVTSFIVTFMKMSGAKYSAKNLYINPDDVLCHQIKQSKVEVGVTI